MSVRKDREEARADICEVADELIEVTKSDARERLALTHGDIIAGCQLAMLGLLVSAVLNLAETIDAK